MTDPTETARTSEFYDAICAFQRTHRLAGLQHAQLRGLLAEHLARSFPAAAGVAPATDQTEPSRRAGLRDQIRHAVCEAEGFAWDSDMLEPDEYGEVADTVLAVLYREWPWLRAEAEDAALARVREFAEYTRDKTATGRNDHEIGQHETAVQVLAILTAAHSDEPEPPAAAPAVDQTACPDPIECSHEAALGEAREEIRRLGLMVDEYGAGASALTDKLKRVRDLHRETCIVARNEVPPTAFTCSLCEVLDAPAAELRRMADEEQQPEAQPPDTEAQPPYHRWSVETRDAVADQWTPGTPVTARDKAVERFEHITRNWPTWKDGTPVQRRLVRATTTYTVEAEHTPEADRG